VIVEIGTEESAAFRNLRNSLPDVPFSFVEDSRDFLSSLKASKDPFGGVKGPLYLTRHKGEFLKMCPGSEGQVCCNFFVVNFASNCPMDCS
jgi:spore photoproduct lyase